MPLGSPKRSPWQPKPSQSCLRADQRDYKVGLRRGKKIEGHKKEKRSTFAILMLILVIATFNLIGALTMMVLEKKKDLGTFKSLGGTKRLIRRIYYFEGITISLIGALLGMVLGVALVMSQTKFHLLKLENSIVEHYPVELMGSDLVLILFVTLLLGLLTSIYPAKMAAREIGS
jgi:lipoprotein-releasing system permease protein